MRKNLPFWVIGVLAAGWVSAASAQQDALVLIGTGAGVDGEMAADLNESVMFAVGKDKGLKFLPKERVMSVIGYKSPDEPGSCVFDNECLREKHAKLKTRYFIVVRVTAKGSDYQVVLNRIGASSQTDVVMSATTPKTVTELLNRVRALVVESLEDPKGTIVIEVSEADAVVEIDGKQVGTGTVTLERPPGEYTIRVSKPDFVPFESKVKVAARQKVVVAANIVAVGSDRPVVIEDVDNRYTIMRIVGWTAFGVGAAMTVVGIIFGVEAKRIDDELADKCAGESPTSPCSISRPDADDEVRKGENAALIFNAVGIPGMIIMAGGLVTTIIGHVSDPRKSGSADEPAKTSWKVEPVMMGSHGGVGIRADVRF